MKSTRGIQWSWGIFLDIQECIHLDLYMCNHWICRSATIWIWRSATIWICRVQPFGFAEVQPLDLQSAAIWICRIAAIWICRSGIHLDTAIYLDSTPIFIQSWVCTWICSRIYGEMQEWSPLERSGLGISCDEGLGVKLKLVPDYDWTWLCKWLLRLS